MAEAIIKTGQLKKLLECPICFETSKPPIHSCIVGHLICNDCVFKVKMCPICRSEYTGTRNFTAEDLWRSLNSAGGFLQGAKAKSEEKVQDRRPPRTTDASYRDPSMSLSSDSEEDTFGEDPNEFRPIKCCLASDECKNSMVDFFSYFEHLRNVHKVFNCDTNIHCKRQAIKGNQYVRKGSSRLFIMKCFDREFLISMHQDNGFVWVWASLLGTSDEARGFRARMNIKHDDLEDITWTANMHDIRKTWNDVSTGSAYSFLKVKTSDLGERIVKFRWTIQVEILKHSALHPSVSRFVISAIPSIRNLSSPPSTRAPSSASASISPGATHQIRGLSLPVRPILPRSQSFTTNRSVGGPAHLRQMLIPPPLPPEVPPRTVTFSTFGPNVATRTGANLHSPVNSLPQRQSIQPSSASSERIRTLSEGINRVLDENTRSTSVPFSQPTSSNPAGFRHLSWDSGLTPPTSQPRRNKDCAIV